MDPANLVVFHVNGVACHVRAQIGGIGDELQEAQPRRRQTGDLIREQHALEVKDADRLGENRRFLTAQAGEPLEAGGFAGDGKTSQKMGTTQHV